ncbi:hypothetical protein BWI97_22000 [Siphonobacter sp. BAB-5405]|nr:hypothetical protein BWI97_22000 [Siphonobacter sp. BAB-5405]
MGRSNQKHNDAGKSLKEWNRIVKQAAWTLPQDILQDFPRAKILNGERARFTIKGNSYRLVAEINFRDKVVEVRFVGTHAEYDRIDALTI